MTPHLPESVDRGSIRAWVDAIESEGCDKRYTVKRDGFGEIKSFVAGNYYDLPEAIIALVEAKVKEALNARESEIYYWLKRTHGSDIAEELDQQGHDGIVSRVLGRAG